MEIRRYTPEQDHPKEEAFIHALELHEGEATKARPAEGSAQKEANFQSPPTSTLTQADRKAERAARKAARKKEREQVGQEKRAKAEQFRVTHKGSSLAKAHLVHNFEDSSRYTKLRRKGVKFTRSRPLFNPNPNT